MLCVCVCVCVIRKGLVHNLLFVVSLVSFRSRQLSTFPAYNRQHLIKFPKKSRIGVSCTQFSSWPAMWSVTVVLYLCVDI